MEVAYSTKGLALYQKKYTTDLIEEFGLFDAKPVLTPMDYTVHLSKTSGEPMADPTTYIRLIGKLQYLTNTRPHIAFVVGKLSQYLESPTNYHHKAAMKIVRYLKRAPGTGLFFHLNSDFTLTGFVDVNWTTCPDTRRYVSEYCFFLRTALISWKSSKQQTISRSSSDAEYQALANVTCEGLWLVRLLRVFGVNHEKSFTLYSDS
ncbi:secreted RxLR effector protein 161-like [Arachis stenosperma]|uniref:secreted RxLR effector protein 161-like n=1 Tax=Arachis stenosperma TaxID=217475 RepID=UPI0025ACB65D|nr:secreted RxLR effector protein 161-like [Arachis stenosperma]